VSQPPAASGPKVLVFLHGYDDDADRWRPAAEAMAPAGCVVERPTGPVRTPTGAAWFGDDGDGLPLPGEVRAALDAVAGHVRAAAGRHGAAPAEVALAGFSQGAAVALLYALHPDLPASDAPGAVVAVSGWLPEVDGIPPPDGVPRRTRLLVAHGTDDDVVPLPLGRSVARLLERRGHDITFVEREAGHDPDPFAADVRDWLGAGDP
jgi:phospholipase/carboxylesterase